MSDRSAKSSKEKKSKSSSSSNGPTNSQSTTSSQQPLVVDEAELERQYQVYKKQFDEWTAKNKGVVSQDAYNKYVEQFKNWEKEIDERRRLAKQWRNASGGTPGAPGPQQSSMNPITSIQNGGTFDKNSMDFSAMATMDPCTSMMMMAMMMMPLMMMAPPVAPVATPAQALPEPTPTASSSAVSITGAPVKYKPPPAPAKPSLPNFIPLPDMSKPPPIPLSAPQQPLPPSVAPRASASPSPADVRRRQDYDRDRRHQRNNDRYFDRGASDHHEDSHHREYFPERRDRNEEYDDYWYRRVRERKLAEAAAADYFDRPPPLMGPPQQAPPFVEPFLPRGGGPPSAPANELMFRGANFEPLRRGVEPWMQSGFGANDFSMRKHERHYRL